MTRPAAVGEGKEVGMDRQEVSRQSKGLRLEEMESRSVRPESRLNTRYAMILGAVLIVAGLGGGKLIYDYLQAQREKAALNEAILQKQAEAYEKAAQYQPEPTSWEEKYRAKKIAEEEARDQAEQAREARDKRLNSVECQFWTQQHGLKPSNRTAQKKLEFCGE